MKKINLEKLLLIFIILLPILDMSSFLFRNYFHTQISVSTFLRPIIPIVLFLIIFFKNKFKLKTILIGIIYLIYSMLHLYIYTKLKTELSYGSVINEAQYIINYSFAVLNLFVFSFVFYKKEIKNIKIAILITNAIYLLSIFISVITKTYSATYVEEGIGIKGWFESGNSISAILILNLFIVFLFFKNTENIKLRILAIIEIVLAGIFLIFMLGTRTGLFGFVLVNAAFIFSKILILIRNMVLNKNKIKTSQKIILVSSAVFIVIVAVFVGIKGSSFLKRRQYLAGIEDNIFDEATGQTSHITGDVLQIKKDIENNKSKLSDAEQKSILELYNYANKHNIKNTDYRKQQLIYNFYLVKNQSNIIYILLGNGFLAHFGELVLEMEIPAFIFNFGLIGFILYFIPFFSLFIYYIYKGIKNIKIIDDEYIFLVIAVFLSFALSLLLGRLFFNSSAMVIISSINAILLSKQTKMITKQ